MFFWVCFSRMNWRRNLEYTVRCVADVIIYRWIKYSAQPGCGNCVYSLEFARHSLGVVTMIVAQVLSPTVTWKSSMDVLLKQRTFLRKPNQLFILFVGMWPRRRGFAANNNPTSSMESSVVWCLVVNFHIPLIGCFDLRVCASVCLITSLSNPLAATALSKCSHWSSILILLVLLVIFLLFLAVWLNVFLRAW